MTMIDASHLKTSRTAASLIKLLGHIGRTRSGLNFKFHAAFDVLGRLIILRASEGQMSERKCAALLSPSLPHGEVQPGDTPVKATGSTQRLPARASPPVFRPRLADTSDSTMPNSSIATEKRLRTCSAALENSGASQAAITAAPRPSRLPSPETQPFANGCDQLFFSLDMQY